MSGSRWVTTLSWLSWSLRIFLYSTSVYSCHLFLISSVRSLPFLSFIMPILAWNVPLMPPVFLKRSLIFPILLFPLLLFIFHWRRPSSLLSIFWNSAFSWVYLSPYPFLFASFLSSVMCKASSDNHFAFLHFLFWDGVHCLLYLGASIHCSSGTLSTRSNLLNLFVTSTV